ncbi:MAG: YfbM family protein, partial [Spirochaetaceae bacterium]|nr:YfbM family protein [Spirochaetaceae bacterium]
MGLLGVYMTVDQNTLDNLKKIDGDELVEELDELEETNEIYNIDKLWDGLHFLLTGVSANSPIEGNKLSEAIVGINVFETDDDYFVSYTEKDKLLEIYNAMKDVNIKELEEEFDPRIFKKNKIYPKIWEIDKKDELFRELINEYN